MSDDLPLPELFHHALTSLSSSSNLPTLSNAFKESLGSALSDLRILQSRVATLSLFSSNETLDDVSTRDLVYMAVPFVHAEAENRAPVQGRADRLEHMQQAERAYNTFIENAEQYGVISEEEAKIYSSTAIADPTRRRDAKIKMYKAEKDVRTRIETVRKRTGSRFAPPTADNANDLDLLAALLPSPGVSDDDLDSDVEDALREATLLLLRLCYAQARTALGHLSEELALLRSAPPEVMPEERERDRARSSDSDWKLDAPRTGFNRDGPLLDPEGRPLQPFTILPGGDRGRMAKAVFGPDHRLPSMTIDEYLEVERARGGIIEGGGAASAAEPTSKEQLALDAEMDGSRFGMDREEEKRVKDEEWSRYTDENKRGAGNTMNRG